MSLERGAVSTELAVLTPLLIGFMLLVVLAGRTAQVEGDVQNAAHEAARAASLAGAPAAAAETARSTVTSNIAEGSVSCRSIDVTVDTTAFAAGGQVTVTVACETTFADLAMLAVPGSRTFEATAIEVVDRYRADTESPP